MKKLLVLACSMCMFGFVACNQDDEVIEEVQVREAAAQQGQGDGEIEDPDVPLASENRGPVPGDPEIEDPDVPL